MAPVALLFGGSQCLLDGSPLSVGSESGIGTPTASGSLSVSGEGTHNISCTATDSASNTGAGPGSSNTATAKIDTTPPTITGGRTPAANANGWNNTDVTVKFTCTDSVSGLAVGSPPADTVVSAEGANQSANGSCTDLAGNSASATVSGINIDKTPPSATATPSPGANANGWNNTNVTVNFTGSDSLSGIDTCAAPITLSVEGAGQSASGTCTDKAGNVSGPATASGINIDKAAPTITASRAPAANANGWNNTDVLASYSASDSLSGLDSAATGNFNFTLDGANQSHTFTVMDKAGNSASATVSDVNIDKMPPSATATPSPAANANGWNNTNVTVTFAGSDSLSGIDFCTAATTLSAEGAGQSASGTCTDKAGNVSPTATASGINIDKTKPTASASASPGPNANGWNNADVTVTFSGSDSLSGIDSCTSPAVLSSEGAGQSASGTCTDKAGNVSDAATASGINIDKTPPSLTGAATPAPNVHGWNNVDVTVTFNCIDGLSGVDSGPGAPQLVSTEGAGQSRSASCTDKAGNTVGSTVSGINIDKTPPIVTPSASPAPNANGWNNIDVAVHFSGIDSLSGIDTCDPDVTLSSEGMNQSAGGSCKDKAGNTGSATKSGINIDKTAPTLVFGAQSPAANAAGWNNTNVSFSFTASDNLSGVDTTNPASSPLVLSSEGSAVTGTVTVTDKAGNSAISTSPAVKIDKTPPSISGSRTPAANSFGWNNSDVTASFTCSDSLSGPAPGSPPADTLVSTEGANQSVSKTCYDLAGNSASATVSGINIDKTPPSATATPLPVANANGWNNTNVTVNFTGSDSLSGIDTCAAPITLSAEGAGQSASGTCTDRAGNVSGPATASGINIDKTKPTLSPSVTPNPVVLNGSATASAGAQDLLSGIASQSCDAPVTNSVGAKTLNCTATDKAGNSNSASVSYSVIYAPFGTVCLGSPGHTILQPINADGTSVFKQKSTVPAKFRVCDAQGNSIGTALVVSLFSLIRISNGTVPSVDEAVDSTTPDTAFRWDPTGQQWIFNMSTKNLSANVTYGYLITLNDGSYINFQFGLK
ncbi:MAG TPA: PxKF domain-containing protein [Terriglobales bacterium]